jgi:hypothetical protein
VAPPTPEELARAFREAVQTRKPRADFLRRFLAMVKLRYGFQTYGELAKAAVARMASTGAQAASEALRLERRLSRITKPTHTVVWLRPAWAGGIAALAFPGEGEIGLRKSLIRYLVRSG